MAERSLLLVARVGVLYHSNRREPVQTHWTVILNTEGDRLTKVKEVEPQCSLWGNQFGCSSKTGVLSYSQL